MIIAMDFNPRERQVLLIALERLYEVPDYQGASQEELDRLCEKFLLAEDYAHQFKGGYVHASDALIYTHARIEEYERNLRKNADMLEWDPIPDPFKFRSCNGGE